MKKIKIAIEGADVTGKASMAAGFAKLLEENGLKVKCLSFPRYTTTYGKKIKKLLNANRELSLDEKVLLMTLFAKDREDALENIVEEYDAIIYDRFFYSNTLYNIHEPELNKYAHDLLEKESKKYGDDTSLIVIDNIGPRSLALHRKAILAKPNRDRYEMISHQMRICMNIQMMKSTFAKMSKSLHQANVEMSFTLPLSYMLLMVISEDFPEPTTFRLCDVFETDSEEEFNISQTYEINNILAIRHDTMEDLDIIAKGVLSILLSK